MNLKLVYWSIFLFFLVGCDNDNSYKFEYLFAERIRLKDQVAYQHYIFINNYEDVKNFYALACNYRDTVSFYRPVVTINFLNSKKLLNKRGTSWVHQLEKDCLMQLTFNRRDVLKKDTCPSLESIFINEGFKGTIRLIEY